MAEAAGDPADEIEEINTEGVSRDEMEYAEKIAAAINAGGGNLGNLDIASNPAMLAALQQHMAGLHGLSSGLLEALPKSVKRRIKALKKIQHEHVLIEAAYQKELTELLLKYEKLHSPLYEKRAAIVAGSTEPTDEDCDWVDADDLEDEDDEEDTAGEDKKEGEEDEKDETKGIPNFWLTCFQNCEPLEQAIEDQDVEILRHIKDVQLEYSEDGKQFAFKFHFEPNEYLEDEVLTKTYHISLEPDDEDLVYDGATYQKAIGCTINWKKGKNPTQKVIKKKQRKKGGPGAGKVRTVTRTEKQASFFNFFDTLDPPSEEEEMDEASSKILEQCFRDFEMADYLKEKVIPRAVLWFTGEAADYEEDGESDEDDMDDDEGLAKMFAGAGADAGDDDDSDEDPDYVPPAMEKPAECKQS